MMDVEPAGLGPASLGLQATRGGVGFGARGAGLGGGEAAAGEIEGIPAEAEIAGQQHQDRDGDRRGQREARRPGQTEQGARAHGKAFRSSSKWGPSRRRGQSPPQTIGVPCRTAAALKAAAMRG